MRPVTRRRLFQQASAASIGLLFRARFCRAEVMSESVPESLTGPPGTEVQIRVAAPGILRISVTAAGEQLDRYYNDGSLALADEPKPLATLDVASRGREIAWGEYTLLIATGPLRVTLCKGTTVIQRLTFRSDENEVHFGYGGAPVYGLGPGSFPLDQRGRRDAMKNGAGENLAVLGARNPIPWLMGKDWGLFFHEPGGSFDLTGPEGIFHPSDVARGLDLFLLTGDHAAELLKQYATLTGFPHLPAKWTFGFQQSHRTLESRKQILEEAETFRNKNLPCDALIYLGTGFCPSGWNTGHGSFTFNQTVFPEPKAEIEELTAMHFHVVLHVVNPPENLHGEVADRGEAAKAPGDAAHYWAQHVPLLPLGVAGWWPDEGDILPTSSRLVRNRMYWEGGRESQPDCRPFALHRNCYAGIQRWGWLWSGDVFSTWKTLQTQIMMGINAGLNGVPYWGTDIGGFVPTAEFTAELFLRWFQFGAFCPSFRCHGRTWQLRRPWGWNTGSYGPSEMGPKAQAFLPKSEELHNTVVEPICRRYLELRSQLQPYLYSAAWETHTTGMPLIRSLGLAFPDDNKAWQVEDAYLFGPHLLVAPVYTRGALSREVYLPSGPWFDFWTGKRLQGGRAVDVESDLRTLPLFVRGGSVLPMGPVKQYVDEITSTPLQLIVYPGQNGDSTLYSDDGLSFGYERNEYATLLCEWNERKQELRLRQTGSKRWFIKEVLVNVVGQKPVTVELTQPEQLVKL